MPGQCGWYGVGWPAHECYSPSFLQKKPNCRHGFCGSQQSKGEASPEDSGFLRNRQNEYHTHGIFASLCTPS